MRPKLIFCFFLVLGSGFFGFLTVIASTPLTFPKTLKSGWVHQTNKIMGISYGLTIESSNAVYNAQYLPTNSLDVRVIALRDTQSGNIYVGQEMIFYVETESKIVGAYLSPGTIEWCDGLVSKQKDLQAAIDVFDKKVDGRTLAGTPHGHDTDLRNILKRRFFTRRGDMDSETVRPELKSVTVKDAVVQIDLENPVTHSTASVWVDTKSWKLIKAVEDGEKVFPKPWW